MRGRLIANSRAWFSDGTLRKAEARRSRHCVECRARLADSRSPYCSRRCQWAFRGHYYWDAARTFVMFRDRYTCQLCRRRQRARTLQVDHIVEIARGGAALDYLNLQTVCRRCHSAKTRAFLRDRRGPRVPASEPAGELPDWAADWFPA